MICKLLQALLETTPLPRDVLEFIILPELLPSPEVARNNFKLVMQELLNVLKFNTYLFIHMDHNHSRPVSDYVKLALKIAKMEQKNKFLDDVKDHLEKISRREMYKVLTFAASNRPDDKIVNLKGIIYEHLGYDRMYSLPNWWDPASIKCIQRDGVTIYIPVCHTSYTWVNVDSDYHVHAGVEHVAYSEEDGTTMFS